MAKRKYWEYLKPGDIVDVVAPSSWCSQVEFDLGVKYLASLGLQIRFPKNIFKPDFIYANSMATTLDHLKKAFYSPDSKAIWCARGGAGSFRFLSELKKWRVPQITKVFIGLSDITTLHVFLNQKWNWPTLHGPMISMLTPQKASRAERQDLERVIFGKTPEQLFLNLIPMNKYAQDKRRINGPILVGNLCFLQNNLGTPWQPKSRDRIVFFEDIDERGYEVERMLVHLENARFFKDVSAVVIGEFVGGLEKDGRDLVKVALKRFAERMKIPVVKGVKSGHGSFVRTLPLNTPATLTTGKTCQLVVETGGFRP